jgi:Zn-dependent alcohol dehydrogenase
LGGIGLNVIQGARMVGADRIIGDRPQPGQARHGRAVRHDGLHQPPRGRDDKVVQAIVDLTAAARISPSTPPAT